MLAAQNRKITCWDKIKQKGYGRVEKNAMPNATLTLEYVLSTATLVCALSFEPTTKAQDLYEEDCPAHTDIGTVLC